MDKAKKTNRVNEVLNMPLAPDFEKTMEALFQEDKEFVLAMFDLDTFLEVNERFGYAEGDRVLIESGEFIRAGIGALGVCYRYGGDEFAIIFSEGIEKELAFLTLENIRKQFAVTLPDQTPVTISIGVAAANEDAVTPSELVRKAEGAMIRAKQLGRNRVCLARDDKMVTKTAHYTVEQLHRLTKISKREGIGEAILLREALDALLKKYDA